MKSGSVFHTAGPNVRAGAERFAVAGHPTGDMVLRQVGAAFVANTKGSDLAARYGGDGPTGAAIVDDVTGSQDQERVPTSPGAQRDLTVTHRGTRNAEVPAPFLHGECS